MKLTWRRLTHRRLTEAQATAIEQRVDSILESWVETPYQVGQRAKGVGVDCVRFVSAVLDELFREERIPLPRLAQDLSMHDPKGARAVMKQFMDAYTPNENVVRDRVVEAGDVLIVGVAGPAHAILVGSKRSHLYEAGSNRVIRTGMSTLRAPTRVFAICRPLEKNRWA